MCDVLRKVIYKQVNCLVNVCIYIKPFVTPLILKLFLYYFTYSAKGQRIIPPMSSHRLYHRIRDVYRVDTSNKYRNVMARMDLDFHADTSVLGSSFKVLEDTEQTCMVSVFLESYPQQKMFLLSLAVQGTLIRQLVSHAY